MQVREMEFYKFLNLFSGYLTFTNQKDRDMYLKILSLSDGVKIQSLELSFEFERLVENNLPRARVGNEKK